VWLALLIAQAATKLINAQLVNLVIYWTPKIALALLATFKDAKNVKMVQIAVKSAL